MEERDFNPAARAPSLHCNSLPACAKGKTWRRVGADGTVNILPFRPRHRNSQDKRIPNNAVGTRSCGGRHPNDVLSSVLRHAPKRIGSAPDHLLQLKDPRRQMAWKLFQWMGNRRREPRRLRWSSLVAEHGAIVVRESVWEGQSSPPKTKKGYRKILFTDEQMEILLQYKRQYFPDAQPHD